MKFYLILLSFTLTCRCFTVMAQEDSTAPTKVPTAAELLDKVESNSAYKEVMDKGFGEKNKGLDLAILEVMATKELTEQTASGLSDAQLDLTGFIMAYGKNTRSLPEKLVAAFRKSPNLRYTTKSATLWEEKVGEYISYSCFEPAMDPVVVFPEGKDRKFADGKSYAQIVNLDNLPKGRADFQFMPRGLVRKDRRDMASDGRKFEKALDTLKAGKISDSTMKLEDLKQKLIDSKSKTIWITVHPWNILKSEEIAGGKGVVLNIENKQQPSPPMIVKIPFKEFVQHAKLAGWEGKNRPGCEEGDGIEIITEIKGKKTITNEKGVLIEAAILEAVAVDDGYGVYEK